MIEQITDMFTREWDATPGGLHGAWLAVLMSFVLGQLIGWVYMWTHTGLSYSRSFTVSLVVIPTIVALVMMVMIDNIVVAFGLFAVFAIVRFRNIVKDTRDTSFVLWAIVAGLSTGTLRFSLAVNGCLILAAIFIYLHMTGFGTRARFDSMLSLLWRDGRAGVDRPGVDSLHAVLRRHAGKIVLASERGVGDGGLRLTYHLSLRDPDRGADLIAELEALGSVEDASVFRRDDESEV